MNNKERTFKLYTNNMGYKLFQDSMIRELATSLLNSKKHLITNVQYENIKLLINSDLKEDNILAEELLKTI